MKGVRSAEPQAPGPAPVRVMALVIGNSAYPSAPLVNPRNDALAVAERFRRYGIDVDLVLDANRRRMVDALGRFAAKAQEADLTLLFYAGHGMQVNGINCLLPTDIDLSSGKPLSITLKAVSLIALLEEHLPGKTKIVFLDACRDNPLACSLAASRGGARGQAPMNAATGTLISYATRDGSTASDGSKGNSPLHQRTAAAPGRAGRHRAGAAQDAAAGDEQHPGRAGGLGIRLAGGGPADPLAGGARALNGLALFRVATGLPVSPPV